jgi:hypothetical protein
MSYLSVKPGTAVALFQHGQTSGFQSGVGAYEHVGDWGWEFFGPNAFAFLDPADSAPQPAPQLGGPSDSWLGLGGCGCGGTCGGCGHKHGVGGLGQGLFESTDISTWGVGEWVAVAAVGWLALSLISGTRRAGAKVAKAVRRRKRAS